MGAAFVACTPTAAQTLVFPSTSSVDRPVAVQVRGLAREALATLRTEVVDAGGQLWTARARFRADAAGTVDTGRDSSLSGSYRGVETAGLFIHMHAVGDTTGRRRFQTAGLPTLATTIAVDDSSGRTLDSIVVDRFFLGPTVRVAPVSENGLRGRLFAPDRPRAPGVVVLGGSDGGYPDDVAVLLATNGFFALSLAYFGVDSLPTELREIPLDYVAQAIEWLGAQPAVSSDRMALFGTSKGAEAALLVASRVPALRAVVAYAPSSVAWSCICSETARSSWSYRGSPVLSVPPGADPAYRPAPGEPLRPTVNYVHRLRSAPAGALIPVERIPGPVLLVAGGDDQLWPSLPMARAIMDRRASMGGHADDQLWTYPHAGHLIAKAYLPAGSTRVSGGRLETGGTPEENARAQADAWPRVLAFLAKALGHRVR
jgi:hypothetical protein